MNSNGTPMISVQHVDKSFGGKQVLRDLSIEVERGESVVIVGGSGTGKSVTLKHMIGLLRPDAGRTNRTPRPAARAAPL